MSIILGYITYIEMRTDMYWCFLCSNLNRFQVEEKNFLSVIRESDSFKGSYPPRT